MDNGAYMLGSSIAVSIGIAVSGLLPRIRKDVVDGLRLRIEGLEEEVAKCVARDTRRKARLDEAWARLRWMEENTVLKRGTSPPPLPAGLMQAEEED